MDNQKIQTKEHRQCAASELAVLAVALSQNGKAPQLHFQSALRLLKDAERFLAGDSTVAIHHAKTTADLEQFKPRPLGWPELIEKLGEAPQKRAGRNRRTLSIKKVRSFLEANFRDFLEKGNPDEPRIKRCALFEHHLDANRLSQRDAEVIAKKWRSERKEDTRKATMARKTNAAKKRAKRKKFSEN